ncbi:MAG: undecaprenyl diphosphate synthase family protein [Eubacteriales bacterium]|jgi:undecaprenyl diphosphate synthase
MRIPKHLGVIPDGNRRWAQAHGMAKSEGYPSGIQPGVDLVKEGLRLGIREFTFYGFTAENCGRPASQREAFISACVEAAKAVQQCGVSVRVIGDTKGKYFPEEMKSWTGPHKPDMPKVNLLMQYNWLWDVEGLRKEGNYRSADLPRMELVIRWGGRRRLSGFLPLQSAYSDIYVVDTLWPDYTNEELHAALEWYDKQDVTMGG